MHSSHTLREAARREFVDNRGHANIDVTLNVCQTTSNRLFAGI